MNPKYLKEKGIAYKSAYAAILYDHGICFSTKTNDWKIAMIDLVEKKGENIEGVLYDVSDDVIKVFDGLEKVSDNKHNRIKVKVKSKDGNIYEADTFISSRKDGDFIPSKEYIDVIIGGAQINGLSGKYIDYLKTFLPTSISNGSTDKECRNYFKNDRIPWIEKVFQ